MSKRIYSTRDIVNEIKKVTKNDQYIETPKLQFKRKYYRGQPDEIISFDVFTDEGMYKFYFTKMDYDNGITVQIYGDLNEKVIVESKLISQQKAFRDFISKYEIEILNDY